MLVHTMKRLCILSATLLVLGAGCAAQPSAPPVPAASAPAPVVATSTPLPVVPSQPVKAPTKPSTTTNLQLQPTAPLVTKPGPQTIYVTIKDFAFSPQTVAVNVGDTVTWTNKGPSNHTTESDGSLLWSSSNIPVGTSFRHTFKAPGSYPYHDGAFPIMKGTVVVH